MDNDCLIITGGDNVKQETLNRIISNNPYVICVDKGGELAFKYSIKVDVILGDFDSIDLEILRKLKSKIFKFPMEKDFTDTELAVSYAIKLGYKNITIINATGNRIDHVFSTFLLMCKYRDFNIKIIGDNFEAYLIEKNHEILNKVGKTVSIIPISNEIAELTLSGFKYNLINKLVKLGDSLCTSNIIINDMAAIKFKKGMALVIVTDLEE